MSDNYKGLYLKAAADVMILNDRIKQLEQQLEEARAALAAQVQQPSIEDVQSLVDASKIMLEWCVKNVRQWHFSEYDWLHRATERVKASLPPAPEGGE